MGTDEIVKDIIEAGRETDEMYCTSTEAYKRGLESDIADMGNTSAEEPSVITAALFLKKFAGDSDWTCWYSWYEEFKFNLWLHSKGGDRFRSKSSLAYIER